MSTPEDKSIKKQDKLRASKPPSSAKLSAIDLGIGYVGGISALTKFAASPHNARILKQNISGMNFFTGFPESAAKVNKLNAEIYNLREQVLQQSTEIESHVQARKSIEKEVEAIKETHKILQQKEALAYLLESVNEDAHEKLLSDEKFRSRFSAGSELAAFVVSIDIRRSTELMLKAREPRLFAAFMTSLCEDLIYICKQHHGVIEKFTGDGVLAFFPEFYLGVDAGYYALSACYAAQEAFQRCYRENRTSFTSVLKDVGLGIGIDFGSVHLLNMAGKLSIVGQPVVYACRMGGAPAGSIYLNQPAYEEAVKNLGKDFYFQETEFPIKHEGTLICYRAVQAGEHRTPRIVPWKQLPLVSARDEKVPPEEA